MTVLLDVNVLIALAWPNNSAHTSAHQWMGEIVREKQVEEKRTGKSVPLEILTCPITEIGFCRVSINTYGEPSLASASKLLESLITGKTFSHRLLPDSLSASDIAGAKPGLKAGSKITDFYLSELARVNNAFFATFDQGVAESNVHLIP